LKVGGARRIVLVGFMGAGKTAVGRSLSARLAWQFEDVDAVIVERSGRSISDWFRDAGEEAFRTEEEAVTRELLRRRDVVVATGGGWASREGRLAGLRPATLSVWLDVDVAEALRRIGEATESRPLLAVSDPLQAGRRLLASRRARYGLADARVDTNGQSVEDVTSRILEILENVGTRNEVE